MATKLFTSSLVKISRYSSIFGIHNVMLIMKTKFVPDYSYKNVEDLWSVSQNKS